MRVLGIDPGLSRCGVGVIEGRVRRPVVNRVGVIRTEPAQPVGERLAVLRAELERLIAQTRPHAVAVERVFFNTNVRTAIGVAQAAGIALLCAAEAGLPAVEYAPTQVKAEVAGAGDADKDQVAFMVRSLLRLDAAPKPADAADALAVALCHHRRHGGGISSSQEDLAGGAVHDAAANVPPRLAAAMAEAGPGAQVVNR